MRVARLAVAGLVAAMLVGGCSAPPGPGPAGAGPSATGTRSLGQGLVHVHEFPGLGLRLAPPTGRPKLTWPQAARTSTVRRFFDHEPPPQVKLADFTSRFHDPVSAALVWLAVDPDQPVFESGPDFKPPATGDPRRCPLYVVVDATTGKGHHAWQSCDPPYRG
jgi:hypothetical protein